MQRGRIGRSQNRDGEWEEEIFEENSETTMCEKCQKVPSVQCYWEWVWDIDFLPLIELHNFKLFI